MTTQQTTTPLSLGQVVATQGARQLLDENRMTGVPILKRHASGDWGHICAADAKLNDDAVKNGGRVLSIYKVGDESIWVITEADRSSTCILLPSDY